MNIDEIREAAVDFLYVDVGEPVGSFCMSHPFNTCPMPCIDNHMIDMNIPDDVEQWRNYVENKIREASMDEIFKMMNPGYYLSFIYYIRPFITSQELGRILKMFYHYIEYPNMDCNMLSEELVKLFSQADKESLMTKDELKYYNELPKKVKIYRGVTSINKNNDKAVSWTLNKKTAKRFADTYMDNSGKVWEKTVSKDRILCYWQNDDEVIINLF